MLDPHRAVPPAQAQERCDFAGREGALAVWTGQLGVPDTSERQRTNGRQRPEIGLVQRPKDSYRREHRMRLNACPGEPDERLEQRAHGPHALDQSVASSLSTTARPALALFGEDAPQFGLQPLSIDLSGHRQPRDLAHQILI